VGRPNVLLVVLDAVRKDHLSPYGYHRPTTPTLDELADRSTVYERAFAAAPWTPPSHAAMFTGKYPSNNGVFGRQPNLDEGHTTLAELLSERGYTTLGFSNSYHTGRDRGFDRGFDLYHDLQDLPRLAGRWYELAPSYFRYLPEYFLRDFDQSSFQLRRLRSEIASASEPFFGFINLNSAHSPYDPPEPFASDFEEYFDRWDAVDEEAARDVADTAGYEYMMGDVEMTDAEWELIECWYDGELAYVDHLLERFFDALREMNLFEETLILVTSDHGEHFGENGLAYHQFSLSETLLNVPLLVSWPDGETRRVSRDLVSLVDLPATIIEAAGGSIPAGMDGRGLRSGGSRDAVFAEYGRPSNSLLDRVIDAMFTRYDHQSESLAAKLSDYRDRAEQYDRGLQAIRTDTHKLVRATTGETTLYRIDEDQEVPVDDVETRSALSDRIGETLDDLPSGSYREELDDHVEQHLEDMGYM